MNFNNTPTHHESHISPELRAKAASKSTWVSVIVNLFLSIGQILIGIFSKSQGLIADGVLKQDKYKLCQGYGEYLSTLRGLPDFVDGVAAAWNTIKDRKGKMVNGVFVKEQDLVGITNE